MYLEKFGTQNINFWNLLY